MKLMESNFNFYIFLEIRRSIICAKITLSQKKLFQNSVLNKLQAFLFRHSGHVTDTDLGT